MGHTSERRARKRMGRLMQVRDARPSEFQDKVGALLDHWGREARRRAKHADAWKFFDSKHDEAAQLGIAEYLRVACSQAADRVINTRRAEKV